MKIDNIFKLIDKQLDIEQKALFNDVTYNFLKEITDFNSFVESEDSGDAQELIQEITSDMGEGVANTLMACTLEFFLTNEYPTQNGSWNCIEFLLKKRGLMIKPEDRQYLRGLNNSYMSIYEVTNVVPGKSVTLR